MFINKKSPIATLTSTIYEKLAFTLCLGGILVIGFAGPLYNYIESLM